MPHTFVLVPGAWVGAWAWHPVARELENTGHRVVAPTMPGTSAGDDPGAVSLSDATNLLVSEIKRLDLTDIVLVAHDWSGYPVTAAAHQLPDRIAKLVYWSAFVPVAGESLLDTIPSDDREALLGAAKAAGGDRVLVPFERWRNKFVQTAPEPVQELTYRLLRPAPINYFSGALSATESKTPDLPISYLVGTQDLSLDPGEESWATKYAVRLGVEPVTFDACHAAFFTTPALVAKQLVSAAGPSSTWTWQ
jgi:pimeloyl-ACP methyl ester carboxylesterase